MKNQHGHTKKQAYTDFIKNWNQDGIFPCNWKDYCRFPRKTKKRIKRFVVRNFYYTREYGVTNFNPYLLAVPVPKEIFEMFRDPFPPVPRNCCKPMKFVRYAKLSGS